jgi:hypothetical protein
VFELCLSSCFVFELCLSCFNFPEFQKSHSDVFKKFPASYFFLN